MIVLSTKINRELERENYKTLSNYRRASSILKESLATMHALDVIRNDKTVDFSKYTVEWYSHATLKDKYETEKSKKENMRKTKARRGAKLQQLMFPNQSSLQPQPQQALRRRCCDSLYAHDMSIRQLETDLLVQRFVTESANGTENLMKKLLKEHEGGSSNYVSPLHSDVCSQLGSLFMSYQFERTFKSAINQDLGYFKKYLPRLRFRIHTMIQRGTMILLEKSLEDALHTFKLKVAELMDKKFGFVDMCSHKCVAETVNASYDLDEYKNEFKSTNTLQRRADIVKMMMYYYRDKINNIETTADFVLIMLLYLNSATEHTEKGFIDVSSIGTTDKFNLLNTTIDRRKKVKKEKKRSFLKIAPFNFFREEPEEKSGNESIFAIDDVLKTCSLAKTSQNFSSLYEMNKELWNGIQNIYSSSYGFVESRKIKTKSFVTSKIRNVGFAFRWFYYNKGPTPNANFLVNNFSPLVSISLQLTFFLSSMIEQYESSFLANFSATLKKIFTLGTSASNPRNYTDLVSFAETDYLLRHSKADKVQRIITQSVKMLKKKFLSIPYTPTLLAQYISLFLSLWVFENEKNVSLQNPNVTRFKKLFFLSYFVHNSGPVEKAVEIIHGRCRKKTDKIVLGCIDDYGGIQKKKFLGIISRKCKPTTIPIRKRSIRKVLKVLMSSLTDPMDILKIAVDTATRCDYYSRSVSENKSKKGKSKINYDLFVKSELSLRYICANVTKKVVRKIIKDVSRMKNMSEAQNVIDQTLNSLQYLKIRNYKDKDSSISIMCPFMEGNDKSIRDLERNQITLFVHKNIGLLKILQGKILNVFKKSITTREGLRSDSAVSLKVGARKFNGFLYTGENTLHIGLSKSRKVYDGSQFVDELEILKHDGVKRIVMKGIDEENERFYVLSDNTQMSEFDYAIANPSANIVIFDGNNYVSSAALRGMGLENERIVWAGYTVGWTAEFALNTISENPRNPPYPQLSWRAHNHDHHDMRHGCHECDNSNDSPLSRPLYENGKITTLPLQFQYLMDMHGDVKGSLLASTVNFIILNKEGKAILKNTTREQSRAEREEKKKKKKEEKFKQKGYQQTHSCVSSNGSQDCVSQIYLKHATFTLNGILNFVTKAEKGKDNEIIGSYYIKTEGGGSSSLLLLIIHAVNSMHFLKFREEFDCALSEPLHTC
ncbi:rhoptry neck protein 5, putative [Plasmodium ovale curtisi]|uniref:Rhoptry neck protein 5, putative n=1 Tax=Plasmodium ovale curtisi TaxID=864141 RepID=A0A1A8VNE2_PLAOA|nr:rhoptry neck protein 5, putative [Plasmodium ovale curtisi]